MRAPRFIHQHKFDLAADALLLSSGLFALVGSFSITVVWLVGGFDRGTSVTPPTMSSGLLPGVGTVLLIAGVVVGPALAWHLHGRRLHWRLLLAIPALLPVASGLGFVGMMLARFFDLLLSPFTDSEFAGAICVLVLVSILYLTVLSHAIRDAMAPAGDPPMLERLRLLCLTSLVVLAFVVAGGVAAGFAEIGEALIFAMVMGFAALIVTVVTAWVDDRMTKRPVA